MRLFTLVLLFSAGAVALCQSPATALPDQGKNLFSARLPGVKTAAPWNGAQIDPGMIVHPPSTRIGALPPGVPIAQDQYPKLVLQPIQLQSPRAQPFSTTWLTLKVQRIPTT